MQARNCGGNLVKLTTLAAIVLLTLPWLNPFASGPTPAVMPWLVSLACFACALPLLRNVNLVQIAALSWLAAAMLSSAMALLQYFGLTAALTPWINHTGMGEAFANLRQRNQFATLTNIGLAALLWWEVQSQPQRQPVKPADWSAVPATAVLLALGNAASGSRTGLLQLLTLVALSWLWSRCGSDPARRARLKLALLVALTYLLAALILPTLVGHDWHSGGILLRLHDDGQPCASRLTLWHNVLQLIGQQPWLGWGWGELAYAHFITLFDGLRFCEILDNAHNLPLHLAVELGLPLALLVCSTIGWLVFRRQPWRQTDHRVELAWAVLTVIAVHSLLEYPLWYGPFQIAAGLSLWILWRSRCQGNVDHGGWQADAFMASAPNSARRGRWLVVLAVALLGIALYAAWDYRRVSQIYLAPEERASAYRDDTLARIGDSWLFQKQVDFATLTTTTLNHDNALSINQLAKKVLHFSPEARVIESVIESDQLLGRSDEARFYQRRYQAAFPDAYALWRAASHGAAVAKQPMDNRLNLTATQGSQILHLDTLPATHERLNER